MSNRKDNSFYPMRGQTEARWKTEEREEHARRAHQLELQALHAAERAKRGGCSTPFPLSKQSRVEELRALPIETRCGIWNELYTYFLNRMLQEEEELGDSHKARTFDERNLRASRKAYEVYHKYFPMDSMDEMPDSDDEIDETRRKVFGKHLL